MDELNPSASVTIIYCNAKKKQQFFLRIPAVSIFVVIVVELTNTETAVVSPPEGPVELSKGQKFPYRLSFHLTKLHALIQ